MQVMESASYYHRYLSGTVLRHCESPVIRLLSARISHLDDEFTPKPHFQFPIPFFASRLGTRDPGYRLPL